MAALTLLASDPAFERPMPLKVLPQKLQHPPAPPVPLKELEMDSGSLQSSCVSGCGEKKERRNRERERAPFAKHGMQWLAAGRKQRSIYISCKLRGR